MRRWGKAMLLAAMPLLATLGYVAWRIPSFFFQADKQAQYAATYHFIGRELLQGRLPALVPGAGTSANLLLDPQYGLANPIYWLQNILFSRFDDLALGTLLLAGVYLLILQGGVVAWVLRLTDSVAWAAAAGAAGWLGGYTLWWAAPSWHPALASLAFIPWLGWAMYTPALSATRLLGVTGATFAVLAAGWPFSVVAAMILVATILIERWRNEGLRTPLLLSSAAIAGALLAAPGYWFTARAFEWTLREEGLSNRNFLVPNLADVLNTGVVTANSNINTFGGATVMPTPILTAGGISLAVLALLDYRRWRWSRPGMIALPATTAILAFATQAASAMGPLRWPFRMLGPWQMMAVVTICFLAATLGWAITRTRVVAAAGIVVIFLAVSVFRDPSELGVSLAAAGVGALMLIALVQIRQPGFLMKVVPLCVAVAATAILGLWHRPVPTMSNAWGLPERVSDYQEPLGATADRSLVLYPRDPDAAFSGVQQYAEQGVFLGQNYLYGSARPGLGYTPVGQRFLQPRMCTETHGFTCASGPDFITSVEESTGRPWLDLLGINTLVVHRSFLPRFQPTLARGWRRAEQTTDFEVYQRATDSPPGRISFIDGDPREVTATDVAPMRQEYRLGAANQSRRVVLTDVYWPGYRATYNGAAIPVQPLGNSLVAMSVPAGAGDLVVEYRPAGRREAAGLIALGILSAVTTASLGRRRQSA